MKEYILNLKFENWSNQLWFMNDDTVEVEEKWRNAIKEIEKLNEYSLDAMEFQSKVIEYFKKLGFVRVQR